MLVLERDHPHWDGVQKIYRYDNGYGASVVRTNHSYGGPQGLWELAVIQFNSDDDLDFDLDYSTPLTDDVLGYLTEEDVERHLNEIEALPDS